MADLASEIFDIADAILYAAKGSRDPKWKRRESFKQAFPEQALFMCIAPYSHHIQSLTDIYQSLEGIKGEKAQQAREGIRADIVQSLAYMDKYRTTMKKVNADIDIFLPGDLKRLDEIVERSWKVAKPCLPG